MCVNILDSLHLYWIPIKLMNKRPYLLWFLIIMSLFLIIDQQMSTFGSFSTFTISCSTNSCLNQKLITIISVLLFADDVVAMAADEEILITDVAEYLQLGVAYLSGRMMSKSNIVCIEGDWP